jgi:hypothetical protein
MLQMATLILKETVVGRFLSDSSISSGNKALMKGLMLYQNTLCSFALAALDL